MNNTDNTSLNIALFGATGGTGSAILERALADGHHVTVLVRNPDRLDITHPRLTVRVGQVENRADVEATIRRQDAVISALGAPALARTNVRAEGARIMVEAMEALGVRRLISLSVLGVGDSEVSLPWYVKYLVFPFYLRRVVADHKKQEQYIEASQLDWTIVRPPFLTDGAATGAYFHGPVFDAAEAKMDVSRSDVADFMVKQLDDQTYVGRTPAVSSKKRVSGEQTVLASAARSR